MKFSKWLIEGLRAGVFLRPRVSGSPQPMQLVGIALLAAAIELALARLEIDGAASFNLRAWLAPWWSTGVLVVLAWWAVQPAAAMELEPQRPAGVAAWMMLWMGAMLPATLVGQALSILQARGQLPAFLQGGWMAWAVYVGMYAWALAVAVRLARLFGAPRLRAGVLAGGLLIKLRLERAWAVPIGFDSGWAFNVIYAAHLTGAVAGAALALLLEACHRLFGRRPPRAAVD